MNPVNNYRDLCRAELCLGPHMTPRLLNQWVRCLHKGCRRTSQFTDYVTAELGHCKYCGTNLFDAIEHLEADCSQFDPIALRRASQLANELFAAWQVYQQQLQASSPMWQQRALRVIHRLRLTNQILWTGQRPAQT